MFFNTQYVPSVARGPVLKFIQEKELINNTATDFTITMDIGPAYTGRYVVFIVNGSDSNDNVSFNAFSYNGGSNVWSGSSTETQCSAYKISASGKAFCFMGGVRLDTGTTNIIKFFGLSMYGFSARDLTISSWVLTGQTSNIPTFNKTSNASPYTLSGSITKDSTVIVTSNVLNTTGNTPVVSWGGDAKFERNCTTSNLKSYGGIAMIRGTKTSFTSTPTITIGNNQSSAALGWA